MWRWVIKTWLSQQFFLSPYIYILHSLSCFFSFSLSLPAVLKPSMKVKVPSAYKTTFLSLFLHCYNLSACVPYFFSLRFRRSRLVAYFVPIVDLQCLIRLQGPGQHHHPFPIFPSRCDITKGKTQVSNQ